MTTLIDTDIIASAVTLDVLKNGGSTRSLVHGVLTPTTGYAVSLPGHEHKLARWQDASLGDIADQIAAWLKPRRDVLAQPGFYVGAWEEAGEVYLDVTQVVPERANAEQLGDVREQAAIYDLAREVSYYAVSVRVPASAERITVWVPEDQRDALLATNATARSPYYARLNADHDRPLFEVVGETTIEF